MKQKLYRSSKDSLLAGVCGGIGEYANIDPTIVRLVTAFLFLGSFGTGLVIYLLAAIIIPRRPEFTNSSSSSSYSSTENSNLRPNEDEVEEVKEDDIKNVDDKESSKINLNK